MHARFSQQKFQPHAHDSWSFCAVTSGVKNIALPSAQAVIARAGDVYLLAPEQAHAGCSVNAEPCEYAMLHISKQEWQRQCALRGFASEFGQVAPQPDPALARQISSFVLERLAQQSTDLNLDKLFDTFLSRYRPIKQRPNVTDGNRAVRIARDHLRTHWSRSVPLTELSERSVLSRYELTRRFHETYGLPPHRYQLAVRIMHAKNYLRQGLPIAEVASSTGFADQSHLGRVFKAMLGITPSAFARRIATTNNHPSRHDPAAGT